MILNVLGRVRFEPALETPVNRTIDLTEYNTDDEVDTEEINPRIHVVSPADDSAIFTPERK